MNEKRFKTDEFLLYLKDQFPNCMDTHWNYDIVENIINYGIKHNNIAHSQNKNNKQNFVKFLLSIIPEITKPEILKFFDDEPDN